MKRREEIIGDARLILGDCREILPTLPRVDAVVTDPPYGTDAYKTDTDQTPIIAQLMRHPSAAIFGYPEHLVRWCVAAAVTPSEWVTWFPTNKPMARGSGLPRASEHIAIFGPVPGAASLMRERSNDATGREISAMRGLDPEFAREHDVWRDPSPGCGFNYVQRQHPNEKPASLMEKLLTLCGGKTILDPFMGSGTTGVACIKLGRKFIGIEIEPKYFDIACRRIEEAWKQPRLFEEPKPKAEQGQLELTHNRN